MSKVMLPGSYDPMTLGHIDIIKRCAAMFEEVIVVIGYNEKKHGLLTSAQRVKYAENALFDLKNVEVTSYDGLTIDFAYNNSIDFIVKGIRNNADVSYENEMAYVNGNASFEKFGKRIETLYLSSAPEYMYISSSVVRQMLQVGLSVEKYVHNEELLKRLIGKI